MRSETLTIRCTVCHNPVVIALEPFDSDNYLWLTPYDSAPEGGFVMPYLTYEERDALEYHICPKCAPEFFWGTSTPVVEPEPEEAEPEEPEEPDDECGFDPYEGAYTFDC